jgi:hypothetical protein
MTKWLVVFQEPYQPDQWTWCATKELAEALADLYQAIGRKHL